MSKPTEMELRVAKAICVPNERYKGKCRYPDCWCAEKAIDQSRAAIRAMREPTTEMLREAGLGATSSTEGIAYMWEAMIDAASPPKG